VIAVLLSTACAVSCSGDDELALNVFDGGFDGASSYEAGGDATLGDARVDATADAGPTDSGSDSGFDSGAGHDSGTDAGSAPDAGLDSGVDASADAGLDASADASSDASADAAADGGDDAGPVINGCASFVDRTDPSASRVIQGPPSSTAVQYDPSCMLVKAGQSVTFTQHAFSEHPLEPANGDTPSPISPTNTGTSVTFAFPNPGTFGYECQFHPGFMFGAIHVVP